MNKKNIIVIPTHITSNKNLIALENCINSIRKYSTYPILVSFSGNVELVKDVLKLVDEYVFISANSLLIIESPLIIFYQTPNWKITYNFPLPRKYHGLAHMQKIATGLQAAELLTYEQFLVINYDAIIMDAGFIDYMFSDTKSIFFRYRDTSFTNTDIFKLNKDSAKLFQEFANYDTYKKLSSYVSGEVVEEAVTKLLNESNLDIRILEAANNTSLQIKPFNVLVNSISNDEAMAVVIDGRVHLLVTSNGSPMHTFNGKIEVGYENTFTTIDVSNPIAILHPITEYKGIDIPIIVRTSIGEYPLVIKQKTLENTTIEWY